METGQIIGWLDADDNYDLRCIKKVGESFLISPESIFVYGNGFQMNKEGKGIKPIIVNMVTFRNLSKKIRCVSPRMSLKKKLSIK